MGVTVGQAKATQLNRVGILKGYAAAPGHQLMSHTIGFEERDHKLVPTTARLPHP